MSGCIADFEILYKEAVQNNFSVLFRNGSKGPPPKNQIHEYFFDFPPYLFDLVLILVLYSWKISDQHTPSSPPFGNYLQKYWLIILDSFFRRNNEYELFLV